MHILDGHKLSEQILSNLAHPIAFLKERGIQPSLDVHLVGKDPASHIYVKHKQNIAEQLGIQTFCHELDEDILEPELLEHITRSNFNSDVHGILVQLPLPKQIDKLMVLEAIHPRKDVDGFHACNFGELWSRPDLVSLRGNMSCTAHACLELMLNAYPTLEGKHVVIIGDSFIVGKPLTGLLLNHKATVSITNIHTQNIQEITKKADILVTATGKAELVKADWVKDEVVIIDVGISRVEGHIVGDVDYDSVAPKAKAITPVPGGVGPMTIANLMRNIVYAAAYQNNIKL